MSMSCLSFFVLLNPLLISFSFFCFILALHLIYLGAPLSVETLDRRKRGVSRFRMVMRTTLLEIFCITFTTLPQYSILDLSLGVQDISLPCSLSTIISVLRKIGTSGQRKLHKARPLIA